MRLKFTAYDEDGSPLEPVVLGDDDVGAKISDWLPRRSQLVDEIDRPRQAGRDYEPRDNISHQISPLVCWAHDSIELAKAFRRDICQNTTGKGVLEVLDGASTQWLENCIIPEVAIESTDGVSTVVRFTIQGGRMMNENPNVT